MSKNNGRDAGHRNASHIGRLQEVLNQIEDKPTQEIVRRVFQVEISYRSAERKNFPRKKIRDIIEEAARTIESQQP